MLVIIPKTVNRLFDMDTNWNIDGNQDEYKKQSKDPFPEDKMKNIGYNKYNEIQVKPGRKIPLKLLK